MSHENMTHVFSFALKGSDEHEQEVPEALYGNRTGRYFQEVYLLVDNQDIAMNIVMSGYHALYLGQEDDEYYFSVNSFIEDMRSIQFHGTCQSAYHYVAACTTKWMNERILEFCKDAGLDGKAGWQLFKEKNIWENWIISQK